MKKPPKLNSAFGNPKAVFLFSRKSNYAHELFFFYFHLTTFSFTTVYCNTVVKFIFLFSSIFRHCFLKILKSLFAIPSRLKQSDLPKKDLDFS